MERFDRRAEAAGATSAGMAFLDDCDLSGRGRSVAAHRRRTGILPPLGALRVLVGQGLLDGFIRSKRPLLAAQPQIELTFRAIRQARLARDIETGCSILR